MCLSPVKITNRTPAQLIVSVGEAVNANAAANPVVGAASVANVVAIATLCVSNATDSENACCNLLLFVC